MADHSQETRLQLVGLVKLKIGLFQLAVCLLKLAIQLLNVLRVDERLLVARIELRLQIAKITFWRGLFGGQTDGERGAFARRTLDVKSPAQLGDAAPRNRKAQAQTANTPRVVMLNLEKRFKDSVHV